jgi:hypothetical protein
VRGNFAEKLSTQSKMEPVQRQYFSYSQYRPNVHLVQVNNVEPANEAFEEYLQFSDWSAKEMKGAVIMDMSKGKFLPKDKRQKFEQVIKANSKTIAKNWISVAYVNSSAITRIIMKGKLWMKPLPVKAKVFTDFEEAVTWSYKNYLSHQN